MDKSKVLNLFFLLFLVIVIPLTVFLASKTQIFKQKATGSSVVRLNIGQGTDDSLIRGQGVPIPVTFTASEQKEIRVAGVDIHYDNSVFAVSGVTCGNDLPTSAKNEILDASGTINLSCYKPGGSTPLTVLPGQPRVLGSFNVVVKNDAPLGSTEITFTRTKIPAAIDSADLSDQGTTRSYTIAAAATPTGSQATPTSSEVTPTSPVCQFGPDGDLDCDGWIEMDDLSAMLGVWGPAPTPAAGHHSADIYQTGDSNGIVNIFDLNKLLGNWHPNDQL